MGFPTWTFPVLILAVGVILSGFFICGAGTGEPTETSNNPIEFIINLLTFSNCDGTPAWVTWTLTAIVTLPLLLILWVFISPLFNNAITAVIASIALITAAIAVAVTLMFG